MRAQWRLENNLHRILNLLFDQNACRSRKGHAAEYLAATRKLAITRRAGSSVIFQGIYRDHDESSRGRMLNRMLGELTRNSPCGGSQSWRPVLAARLMLVEILASYLILLSSFPVLSLKNPCLVSGGLHTSA